MTDERLVHQACQGDTDAFGVLHERYFALLWLHARRITGDRHAAEDIAQETFVRSLLAAGRFTAAKGTVKAWLFRIAHNLALDWLRKRGRNAPTSPFMSISSAEATPHTEAIGKELRKALQDCLDRLPPKNRAAVIAIDVEELSQEEAAVILGAPKGTVASRTGRGRLMLRECLKRKGMAL